MRRSFLFGTHAATGLALLSSAILSTAQSDLELTSEEKQWIEKHPVIRIGITPDWAPFSYFDKSSKPAGVDIDLVQKISERTGLQFQVVATKSWDETLKLSKERRIDVTSSTAQTYQREASFHFTRAYYSAPVVIVSREHDLQYFRLSLLRQSTLAMPRGYVSTEVVSNRIPTARILLTDNLADCFKMVAQRKAQATVVNMITASRYLNDHPEMGLIISGVTEDKFPLRFAIRREAPILASIMDKSVASISSDELDAITSRHLPFGLQAARRGAVWQRRWAEVLFGAAAGVFLLLCWNRFIAKEVRARRRAEAELLEINKSLAIFSQSISHDLRGPLRTLHGFTIALQEDYKDRLDTTANDYLARMNSAVQRLESLIADILTYSQASRSEIPLEPLDLNTVTAEAIQDFPLSEQNHFVVEPRMPMVIGNSALLSQSVSNLLRNAIKFVPKDRQPHIWVHAEKRDSDIRLWIEDNGIGIAPDDQQRIFTLFERVNSREFEGSGIGLAVVLKAVERMGGQTGVLSELGKGSRFWIELPAASTTRESNGSSSETPQLGGLVPSQS